METKEIPAIYLRWLKQNTGHYRYLTGEARALKKKIEECGLSSDEETKKMEEYYRQFVQLSERNPFAGTGGTGKKAEILAESFRYFFYPNREGIRVPMEIFLEFGGLQWEKNARELYDRMEASLEDWVREAASVRQKNKEEFQTGTARIISLYGKLLNQKADSRGFWVKQGIMLCLLAAALLQALLGAAAWPALLADPVSLTAAGLGAAVTVWFLIRSILWMAREPGRVRLLRQWRLCVEQMDRQGHTDGGFRDAGRFRKLMKTMILEPENHKEPAEEEGSAAEPGRVEAAWFLEKRNRKICSTIRPLHLAVMLLTCFCLLLACPRKLIPGAEEPLARLRETVRAELERRDLDHRTVPVYETASMEELAGEIQLTLRTLGTDAMLFTEVGSNTILGTYPEEDTTLYTSGCAYDFGSELIWYAVTDDWGREGFIRATQCRVHLADELPAASVSVTDREGNPREYEDLDRMTDGQVMDACLFQEGDTIRLEYASGCRFKYLYLVPGDVETEGTYEDRGRPQKLRLVFDETREYSFSVPDAYEPFGIFVRIPDVAASTVEITLEDAKGGESREAALTELKLCGVRLR